MNTLDDFMQTFEQEQAWRKEHKIAGFVLNCYDFIRYTLPRVFSDTKYSIKWGFQRMFRGYDDVSLWNHPFNNAEHTLVVLRWLRKHKHGIPAMVCEEGETLDVSEKRWNDILDKMIAGFEAFIAMDDVHIVDAAGKYDSAATHKEIDKLNDIWQAGAAEYIKYYGCLWD